MKYKNFIFDMDGTICQSRQVIDNDTAAALSILRSMGLNTVVISGAERERMHKQLGFLTVNYVLAQSGADCPFWQRKMTERDEVEVWRHVRKIQRLFSDYDWGLDKKYQAGNWLEGDKQWNRFVENRGGQISFSFSGHDCPIETKKTFDPDGRRRATILKEIPFHSINLECRIAGTTCFDYTYKDSTKGKNIERLIRHLKWEKDECIYFGDKLIAGGNDETVMGIIKCVQVDGLLDLLTKLKEYI